MATDRDDPFGDSGDSERTVIRPNPGRRAAGPPAAPPPGPLPSVPRDAPGPVVAMPSTGINPVVSAATVLLSLAARLGRTSVQRDVAGLRDRVIEELRLFEQRTKSLSLPATTLRGAHYALCATIDDVVLNTPWGSQSVWPAQSLVSTFHNDVTGGERFFDVLSALQKTPGRDIDVLELMYACLALGMEGKYRVAQRGASELPRIREGLYKIIRQLRGEFERQLSPRWQGVPAPHRALTSYIPTWVLGLVAAVVLLLAYIGFSYALSDASDAALLNLAQLPPRGGVAVVGATAVVTPIPTPTAPARSFLPEEVKAGLVGVTESDQKIVVTIHAAGMFASASATVEPKYVDLLKRIAKELEAKPGKIVILGHTDNVPIRTIRFTSNYDLSLARANAAKAILVTGLSHPERVTAEGRADTDPVASNATAEGKEANRRIEIEWFKAPPQ